MRKHKKGWPKSVEVGYRGPKVARGLHPSGYFEVPVRTIDDLSKVDPKTQAIRIAHTVGMKKRAEISLRASEMGFHILNPLPEVKPEEAVEAEAEVEEETKETKEKEGKEEEKTS
jgi:large subunit ribosomal protein L32e